MRIGAVRVQGGQASVGISHLRAEFEIGFETRDDVSGAPMPVVGARGAYAAQPLTASLTGGALLALDAHTEPWPINLMLANGPTRRRLTIAALPTDLLVIGTLRDPAVQPKIVEPGIRGGIAAARGFVSTPLTICRRSNSVSATIRTATIRCGGRRAGGVVGRPRESL